MSYPDQPAAELYALLYVAEQQAIGQAANLDPEFKQDLANRLERIKVHLTEPSNSAATSSPESNAQPVPPMWRPVTGSMHYTGLILLPPAPKLETCTKCNGQRVTGTGN